MELQSNAHKDPVVAAPSRRNMIHQNTVPFQLAADSSSMDPRVLSLVAQRPVQPVGNRNATRLHRKGLLG
jgi:hypothetical protein